MVTDNKEKNTKKLSAEENIFNSFQNKSLEIRSKKSRFYYFCILIVNICTLIIAGLWLKNTSSVESFSIVWQEVGFKFVLLLLFILLIILMLQTLPKYLKLYNNTGSRRFGVLFRANINKQYFNQITIKSSGGIYTSTLYLSDKKIKNGNAVNLTLSSNFIVKLSWVIYSFVFLVLAVFMWANDINIWLYLIAILPFIVNFIYVMILLLFIKNKKAVLNFVSNVIKFLYNRNIIKDYEKCYNNISDKLIATEKSLKQPKILIITEIFANFLTLFLKGVMLYFILTSLNMGSDNVLGNVLFGVVVLELLISIFPLPKGTLVYEILFILIFSRLFYSGYLFWGMVLYRLFDYFIYAIMYLIVYIIDVIVNHYNTMQTD